MRTEGPINWSNPADRAHPLNAGKLLWCPVNPRRWGGATWPSAIGTAAGNLSGGPTWRATTRPGGAGELVLDGSDDYVEFPSLDGSTYVGQMSFAIWVYSDNASDYQFLMSQTNGNIPQPYDLRRVGGGGFEIVIGDGSSSTLVNSSQIISSQVWHRVGVSDDGFNVAFYIDGVPAGTGTTSQSRAGGSALRVGTRADGYSYLPGRVDEPTVWGRVLSPAEFRADYEEGWIENPGPFNRVGRVAFGVPVGGGATTLDAPGASVAITPGTAALSRSRLLPATGGSVAITVGAAGLLRSRLIPATGASVAITAGAAAMIRSRVLPAPGASVAITAGTAALIRARVLAAPGASVAATAGDASLLRSLVLPSAGASVAITPGNAELIPPAAPGTLAAPARRSRSPRARRP